VKTCRKISKKINREFQVSGEDIIFWRLPEIHSF